MIIDEINKENLQALKDKDTTKKTVLGVVKNKFLLAQVEARQKGKEVTDTDMIAILQKTVKELTEEAESYKVAGRLDSFEEISKQREIIQKFLPQMMSEQEIKAEIEKLDDKTIPNIMKHFKINFAGKVDMGLVNKIARG